MLHIRSIDNGASSNSEGDPILTTIKALGILFKAASPSRRRLFVLTIVLMLVGAVAELATIGAILPFLALVADPRQMRGYPLIGKLLRQPDGSVSDVVLVLAVILVVIAVVAGVIRILLNWLTVRFALFFGHDISREIFSRMLRQPYQEVVMRNSSITLASIDKLNMVIFNLLVPGMQGMAAVVISAFIMVTLFIISPLVATATGVFLTLTYIAVTLAIRTRLTANSDILGTTTTARIKLIKEGFGGIRDILINRSQPVFETMFVDLDRRSRQAMVTNNVIANTPRYMIETVVIVLIAVFTVYFSMQAGGLLSAIPTLGALAIGAQRLLPQVHQAYNGLTSAFGMRRQLFDVANLLQIPVLPTGPETSNEILPPFSDRIAMDRVTFRYPGRQDALREVTLTIRKGERIGFVGRTGSGKSTLIDLIMGLLLPSEGRIAIDGAVLDDASLAWWQTQIAHVPQAIYLSDGSIAANIAFGVSHADIDMDRVRDAARQADIHTFILEQPDGYETTVGERGVRLSGGQRQRIGIARALYKGAHVLVFDEATSALDEATEAAIMTSIYRLDRDITLLMIAHRTSTLIGCDRVVQLDQGRIVDIRESIGDPGAGLNAA